MKFSSLEYRLPSRIVSNADVIERLCAGSRGHLSQTDLDKVVRLTEAGFKSAGTSVRYHLGDGEKPYELCVDAGRRALDSAGLAPSDIDLLVYVGIGRGFMEPATANSFQDLLELRNATCFDVLDACASWLRALQIVDALMKANDKYKNAMILNAEFIGRYAYRYELHSVEEFAHWFPGVTIGEAATATILSKSPQDDGMAFDFRNYGEKRGLCMIPLANYADYLGQDVPFEASLVPLQFASFGAPLLRFGASKLIGHYLGDERFHEQDYDVVFGHPASDDVCKHIGLKCGLEFEKFRFTHSLFGNTVSASLPLAMSLARQEGRLRDGSRVLVLYASAGVSTALARFRYCA